MYRNITNWLKRLDVEGWALKLSKCEFSVNQLTWLGYDINEDGYSPKFSNIEAIRFLKPPRTHNNYTHSWERSITYNGSHPF